VSECLALVICLSFGTLANLIGIGQLMVRPSTHRNALFRKHRPRACGADARVYTGGVKRGLERGVGAPRARVAPDPVRARYRQALNELIQWAVFQGRTLESALAEVPVAAADSAALRAIENTELDRLEPCNCARHNLSPGMTQQWIDAGRRRQAARSGFNFGQRKAPIVDDDELSPRPCCSRRPWRICFVCTEAGPIDVEVVDCR
jgi:hypothetical protein